MRYTIRASALALFVLAISSGVAAAQAAPARFAYVNPQALFESAPGRAAAGDSAKNGLVDDAELERGRVVLTLRGRLLADAVVRALVG